jgi:hypothetical protein
MAVGIEQYPLSSFTKTSGSAKTHEKYQFGDKSGNQRDRVDRVNMLIGMDDT